MKQAQYIKNLVKDMEEKTRQLRAALDAGNLENQVDAVNDLNSIAFKLHKAFNPPQE